MNLIEKSINLFFVRFFTFGKFISSSVRLSKLRPLHMGYYLFISKFDSILVKDLAKQFGMFTNSVMLGLRILEKQGLVVIKKIGNKLVCEVL